MLYKLELPLIDFIEKEEFQWFAYFLSRNTDPYSSDNINVHEKRARMEALKKAARERPSSKQRPMLTVCLVL